MKKIISVILSCIMLLSLLPMATFAEELNAPKLTIDSVDATPGDTATVNIGLRNNPGFVSASINLAFDEGLTLVGAANGDAFPSTIAFTMPNQLKQGGVINGSCNFAWSGTDIDDADIKDGVLLSLRFRVSEDAEIGDVFNITVSARSNDFVDKNLQTVAMESVQGKVTIIDYTPGDVNDDGSISMLDTVMISRYVVDGCTYDPNGYAIQLNEKAADVNDDGSISMLDTVMISRYIVDGCKTDPDGYNIELKGSTKKCQHEMQAIASKAATCTEDGNVAYWYCTRCDRYFSDVNGSRAIALADTVIPATGHTVVIDPAVPATYESTGLTEGSHCFVCGAVIVAQEVVPKPEPETASITYKLVNNDSYLASQTINNPNPSTYIIGRGLQLSNDLEVPGYTFVGWYDSFANNATQIKSISPSETNNITLYAHWERYEYTIQYESDLIPVSDDTYTVNQNKTLPTPKLAGYSFVGWSDDEGNIIKRIPAGNTGDKTYSANWLSDRNQARTKKRIDGPVILEEDNKILFTYEIGEIRNVPVSLIHDFGKIVGGGVSSEQTVTHSKTVNSSYVTNYAKTVADATTNNFGITLSNGWTDGMTANEEYCAEHELTQEEAKSLATNESNNWYISNGTSGTSTTTTYNTTDTTDMLTSTKNNSGTLGGNMEASQSATHEEEKHRDFSFDERIGASVKKGPVKVSGEFEANQSFGSSEKDSTTVSSKVALNASVTTSDGSSAQGGTVTHTGSNSTNSSSWNSESGRGGSSSVTNTASTSQKISEALSEKTSYGRSYILNGSETSNQGFSSQQSTSDSYSTGITYSTAETETITEKISTTNTIEGYHRWVWATTAHVFMVVGYDIATSSYFVCNYSILDDEVKRFEDYSYDTASYDDNQTAVINFEVPTDIKDYVAERVSGSDGLQVSRDGKVTRYTGTDDFVIIPEYKVIDGTVIKVTGINEDAFKGKVRLQNGTDELLGIELSEYITEIPDHAFEGCSALQYVDLKNVTSIGERAFAGCDKLVTTKLNDKVTHLGQGAFDGIDAIMVQASNKSVVDSVVNSGAKAIVLVISENCDDLENCILTIPEETEFFEFYGNISEARDFTDVCIYSNADETVIMNANFDSTKTTPIKISSEDVTWGESNVSAPNFGIIFTADHTNLSVYGESTISSEKGDAILTKNLTLANVEEELYSMLHLNGNILVCDEVSDVAGNGYLSFNSGEIIGISDDDYQKYIRGTYTIRFDANGGAVDEVQRTAYYGTQTETLPIPTRDYYTFDGWYTENGSVAVTPETLVSNADDITLYAHWTLNSFAITFNANGGNVTESDRVAYCGTAIGELPVPERDYYTFVGWFTAESEGNPVTEETTFETADDITLYAHWESNPTSGWVLASDVPENAQVVSRKWSYTQKSTKDSKNASEPGYVLASSEWIQSGSGSKNYASYPSGFDTGNWYYKNWNGGPYSAYENATNKRTVSNSWAGYIYWHWMYDCGGGNGTSGRAILDYYGYGPDNGFLYKYFGAFDSTNGNYNSDTGYCNSRNLRNYIIPGRTSYNDCQGATRWFRFDYYKSTYTDYYKLFHYYKEDALESTTQPIESATVYNIVEWVQYIPKTVVDDVTVGFNGHTYKLIQLSSPTSWTNAKAYCEHAGGHLVTITSPAEQLYVARITDARIWIGGYRVSGDTWAWVTGEPFEYSDWRDGEPNNTDGIEDCIEVGTDLRWNDERATSVSKTAFIIEWD